MKNPSRFTATYCFTIPGPKLANEFTPKSERRRAASGPLMNTSVM